ncbi:homogentisate 1,2-dioxygenase [Paramyrothecium foliicola]|nr:homogentisate 1,2-dioxygenase [Paramyrothecium foliicola]
MSANSDFVLYTYFRSSCSARLRIALNVKGLSYDSAYVNLLKNEQRQGEYTQVNPSHTVPTLELPRSDHDGPASTITQSVAALEYLEERYPDRKALLPPSSDPFARATVRSLVNIVACDIQPVTNLRILQRVAGHGASREEWAKSLMTEGLVAYEELATKTAGRFSVGDEFTLADVCLVPAVWGAMRFGVDLDALPTVKRIFEEASMIDAVVKAHWKNQEDTPQDLRAQYKKMPVTNFSFGDKYTYLNGFGTYQETEALAGALPVGMNSPQKPQYGLYALCRKLSGTSFTAPRHENQQSWLYRILPAAAHEAFEPYGSPKEQPGLPSGQKIVHQLPNQLRWDPFDFDDQVDWVHGLHCVSVCGDPQTKSGLAIYIFAAGKDMGKEAFYSADGDFLIVPQHGVLDIQTEFGKIVVRANEICVIPRGIRYRVTLPEGSVRGYICELHEGHFQLPELGPLGSNGLANTRDFQVPVAAYDEDFSPWTIVAKFNNALFGARQGHSPFDVVAWHGTGHTSPTILTAPSTRIGTAVADFVIFPPRWLVQENTFRPPWYHRNVMSEFMGLIAGDYDAKAGGGFRPAGASLHNIMSAHGPDAETHQMASNANLEPQKVGSGSMAFMFERLVSIKDSPSKQNETV